MKHGKSGSTGRKRSPEYGAWAEAKRRCFSEGRPMYAQYGGRGITMDARWSDDFRAFLADMGPRPSPDHSIDRIDNEGNYEPGNCRWATRAEQNRNRRNCVYVNLDGSVVTVKEYCHAKQLKYRTIIKRIQELNWPIEKALTLPVGSGKQYYRTPDRPQRYLNEKEA